MRSLMSEAHGPAFGALEMGAKIPKSIILCPTAHIIIPMLITTYCPDVKVFIQVLFKRDNNVYARVLLDQVMLTKPLMHEVIVPLQLRGSDF